MNLSREQLDPPMTSADKVEEKVWNTQKITNRLRAAVDKVKYTR